MSLKKAHSVKAFGQAHTPKGKGTLQARRRTGEADVPASHLDHASSKRYQRVSYQRVM